MESFFVISAAAFNLLIAGIFIAQRHGKTRWVRTFGLIVIGLAIPFVLILFRSIQREKGFLVYLSLSMVLLYQVVELLLDYVLKLDFRSKWITHVPYILLEYAAFFGLIYVASTLSQTALWIVSLTFWIVMACLIYLYAGIRKNKST